MLVSGEVPSNIPTGIPTICWYFIEWQCMEMNPVHTKPSITGLCVRVGTGWYCRLVAMGTT